MGLAHAREALMSDDSDATSVKQPSGPPPDEGLAHDPSMTDQDEANIPPGSEADPESDGPRHEE